LTPLNDNLSIKERTGSMKVEHKYIVVQITERDWYVCALLTVGDYRAISKPLGQREARRVCKELMDLEPREWPDATKKSVNWTEPDHPI
jgi:hypothetical protein